MCRPFLALDLSAAEAFVNIVWGAIPQEYKVLVWSAGNERESTKTSTWCDSALSAARALKIEGRRNVYVSAALFPNSVSDVKKPHLVKGAARQVGALGALWADVDYAAHTHKKDQLPERARALGLIANMPLEPSIIVHSGYGYQLWWLFQKRWDIASEGDLAKAATMSNGWQQMLSEAFNAKGYEFDMTHNLDRVMRLPGSLNYKGSSPVPVTIEKLDEKLRYSFEDFRRLGVLERAVDPVTASPLSPESFDFVLDANAKLPVEILADLMDDEVFAATWNKKRRNLDDTSASGYDASLANQMMSSGLSRQLVVNGLVQWRAMHGQDLKLGYPGYYARTLNWVQGGEAQPEKTEDQETEERRQKLIKAISKAIKTEFKSFKEYVETDREGMRVGAPLYELTITGARVVLTAEDLYSAARFKRNVAPHTKEVYTELKGVPFQKLIERLMAIMKTEERGMDETVYAETTSWLVSYARTGVPKMLEGWKDVELSGRQHPFLQNGVACVYLSDVSRWLHAERRHTTLKELADRMRDLGAEQLRLQGSHEGARLNARVWKMPDRISDLLISAQGSKRLRGVG